MAKKTNYTKKGIDYYRTTLVIGHSEKGKPIRKEFYGATMKEANAKMEAYKQDIQSGMDIELSQQRLSEAMRTWLFEVKKVDNDLQPNSFARYECAFRIHLVPSRLGGLIVRDIKSLDIQRFLNGLSADGHSHQLMKNTFKVLRMFFVYATAEGYCTKNPCANIKVPGDKPKKELIETFTDEEIALIKAKAVNHRLRLLVILGYSTGLRKGELLALRYGDIKDNEVHVRANLTAPTIVGKNGVRERKTIIGETKTQDSNRVVPIAQEVMAEVTAHRIRQMAERLALGIGGEPEYIFTTETGLLYDPTNIYRAFQRLLKRAGVKPRKFHALRHTYATKLVRAGVPLPTVQKLLGHSKIDMTMVYVQTDINDLHEAVRKANIF